MISDKINVNSFTGDVNLHVSQLVLCICPKGQNVNIMLKNKAMQSLQQCFEHDHNMEALSPQENCCTHKRGNLESLFFDWYDNGFAHKQHFKCFACIKNVFFSYDLFNFLSFLPWKRPSNPISFGCQAVLSEIYRNQK